MLGINETNNPGGKMSKMKVFVFIMVLAALTSCGGAKKSDSGAATGPDVAKMMATDGDKVLAVVNGENVTEAEVMKAIEPQLKKFQTEIFKYEETGLNQLVDDKLLEQAAKKEGKSKDEYVKEYMTKNATEPNEEEMKKFYDVRKEQMGDKKFEEAKDSIKQFLKANQENALMRKLAQQLRTEGKVQINLEPPRVEINIGDAPTMGPKDAPITIVEWSDYQCPFCGRARATVNEVLDKYKKEVRYAFKDFPLSFHKNAQKAAEAAHCAGEQGKYFEMYKVLFEKQQKLEVADLKTYAKDLGLNTAKFDKCLDDGKTADIVKKNLQEGMSAGVSGTPAFFINGVMLSGARPFSDFQSAIDAELARKK